MVIDMNTGLTLSDGKESHYSIDTSNLKVTGVLPKELTDAQIESICISRRHDFGLLSIEKQNQLRNECKWWFEAIRKEFE